MKTILKFAFLFSFTSLLFACGTAHTVTEDAKKTPIGSVISGETTSSSSYLKKVEEDNKRLDRDTWRPQNSERF